MTAIGTCALRLARPGDARLLARMSRDYIEQGLTWRWRPERLQKKIAAAETVVLVAELDVSGVRFIGGFAVMDFEAELATDKAQLALLAVRQGGDLEVWNSYNRTVDIVFVEWDRKLIWVGSDTGLYVVSTPELGKPVLGPMEVDEWSLDGLNEGHGQA